jgi:hypothetical protein
MPDIASAISLPKHILTILGGISHRVWRASKSKEGIAWMAQTASIVNFGRLQQM